MQHDAVVVGGSFAGLAAATYLARARRSVCVIDERKPRNRFAEASHGYLGSDGSDPMAILARAREQLATYPTVRMMEARATAARSHPDRFDIFVGDKAISASKVILAFGLRDNLPAIPGLRERWGKTVLHCPYCHGFEFSDRQLGVLYRTPMSVHQARMVAEWGPTTLYLNGATIDGDSVTMLAERGVRLESVRLKGLIGKGASLSAVELEDGRKRPVDALYVAPESCLSSPIAERLGVTINDGMLGPLIRTDADKMTTVPGIYAAGDISREPHSVSWAVADGVTAGTSAHRALVFG